MNPLDWLGQGIEVPDDDGTTARGTVVTARARADRGVTLVVRLARGAHRIIDVDRPFPPPNGPPADETPSPGQRLACRISTGNPDTPAAARALARAVLEGRSRGSVERQLGTLAAAILQHVPETAT